MPLPNRDPIEEFRRTAPLEVALAIDAHVQREISSLYAAQETGDLTPDIAFRGIGAYQEIGSRALDLAQMGQISDGEELMSNLVEFGRGLRGKGNTDPDLLSRHRDPHYRRELIERVSAIGGLTLAELRGAQPEPGDEQSPPPRQAQGTRSAELSPNAVLIKYILEDCSYKTELTGPSLFRERVKNVAEDSIKYPNHPSLPARKNELYLKQRLDLEGFDTFEMNIDGPRGFATHGPGRHRQKYFGSWSSLRSSTLAKKSHTTNDPAEVIVEAVSFTPAKDEVMDLFETETTTVPGGLFGRGKKLKLPKQKEVQRENLKGEHLVDVSYVFAPNLFPGNAYRDEEDRNRHNAYLEFGGGRTGCALYWNMRITESKARMLREAAQSDPNIMRELTEAAVYKQIDHPDNTVITTEYWEKGRPGIGHPMRPPWGKIPTPLHIFDATVWDRQTIAQGSDNPFDKNAFDTTYSHDVVSFKHR
jgi:hypothetical protein